MYEDLINKVSLTYAFDADLVRGIVECLTEDGRSTNEDEVLREILSFTDGM